MATRKNTFLVRRSNVAGNVPTAGQLLLGELALNTADVKLYTSGTTANSILPIGWDRISRTGDTMTGSFSAPTISATTYYNLPTDVFVTGGTVQGGSATFINNTGGTFTVTGFGSGNSSGLTSSDYVVQGKLNSDQTIPNSSDTIIDFVDNYDSQGWYNPTTKRFTPTIAGYYLIDCGVWLDPTTVTVGQANLQARRNGSTFAIVQSPNNNQTGQSFTFTKLVYFNGVSDYMDFTFYQNTGVSRSILQGTADGSGTWFSAALMVGGTLLYTGGTISGPANAISGFSANTISATTYYNLPNDLPSGGSTGQILAKIDSTNYNTEWIDNYTSQLKHIVKAGEAISKGQAVYVSSANGTNMIVSKASNASEATSSKTLGLLAQSLSNNGQGFVITEGLLTGLNTLGANAGDPVWLGTSGNLIYGLANKPYAPAHLVFIGIVTRVNSSNGEIFVKVQNGFELDELHDVDLKTTTPINGHILGYNGTLWVNKTIAGWLGFTPANDANVLHTSGNESASGVKTFSDTTQSTSISSGAVIVGGGVGITKNLYVGGNLNLGGNLNIGGTLTTINAQNLSVSDNMIYLNNGIQTTITNAVGNGSTVIYTTQETHNYLSGMTVSISGIDPTAYNLTNQIIISVSTNSFTISNSATGSYVSGGIARAKTSANPDLGFAGGYNDGSYAHTGLFRDATDNVWKFFKSYTPEPDASPYIDTADPSFAYADLRAFNITSNSFIKVGGTSSQFLKADGSIDSTTYVPTNRTLGINGTSYDLSANRSWDIPVVTANTFNNGTYDLTISTSNGSNYTSNLGLLATDVKVTGGTYNINTGAVTFTNSTGGTFNVTGFSSGMTDTFVTGGTYSNGTATFTRSNNQSFNVTGFNTGTVTSVGAITLGTSGTDLSSTVANDSTTPVITLNVPTASASNRGALSSTDWSTFNSKQTALNGTGFIKANGTTITYDNSTYYLASNPNGYTTNTGTVTSVNAGNGMNFSNFTTSGTITLGTPSNTTLSSTNAVTTNSHTHAFAPGGTTAQYITGAGTLVTFPTIPTVNDGTLSMATSGIATGSASFTANQSGNSTFTVNVPATDLSIGSSTSTVVRVDSSTGTDATLPVATSTLAGVLKAADWSTFNGKQAALNGTGFIKANGTTISYDNSTYYLASNPNNYISSYSETDTLSSVTSRGASTSTLSAFNGGLTATKTAKNTYGIQIKGGYYGAPRLQLYDLAIDGNAFLGLGTDMSGAAYEFSNYFPRNGSNGRWSLGSWAGDFGTGQYVSGYNEKLWVNETSAAFNVPLNVVGAITQSGNQVWHAGNITPIPTSRTITINGTGYDLSANRSWSVGTVTSVAAITLGTSGNDLSSSVANGTTTPVITLNVPDASSTARGVITTGSQTIAGTKTFSSTIIGSINGNADTVDNLHASDFVRAYTTTNDNIDSDWGQSFKTFDPVPGGTPPISSPNLRTINIGENYSRRTQLAFDYAVNRAWFRRRQDSAWSSWSEFIHSDNISSYAVPSSRTITINGTTQDLSANRSWTVSATETDTLATVTSRGNSSTGDITVNGELLVKSAILNNQSNNVPVGTTGVFSRTLGSTTAAFFDYVVTSGANARAGSIMAVVNGSSVEYTETSTNDIGSTTSLNFAVVLSGGNLVLNATSSSGTWTVKVLGRLL